MFLAALVAGVRTGEGRSAPPDPAVRMNRSGENGVLDHAERARRRVSWLTGHGRNVPRERGEVVRFVAFLQVLPEKLRSDTGPGIRNRGFRPRHL
nr:hypothetical protein GCM10020241_46150 [Streptoalloteichus tenebrarius]